MDTIAKDINSLIDLFQKSKSELDEIITSNPASNLARVLQLKNDSENSDLNEEKIRSTALYAGNTRWFEFLINRMNAKSEEREFTDHFAVTIPEVGSQAIVQNVSGNIDSSESIEEKLIENVEGTSGFEESHPELVEESDMLLKNDAVWGESGIGISEEVSHDSENPTIEGSSSIIQNTEQELGNEQSQLIEKNSTIELYEEQEIEMTEEHFIEENYENKEIKISSTLPQEEKNSSEFSEGQGAQLNFEPLHTIDYFASQGIKLSEADLDNDRLGQQVKSFTGWLKSMKKLHPGKLPEQDEVIQQIIQNAAEVSNVESDVLTEAMAEVLVKQNKREKAVEMYEKLSLMNPSKSAYFAAKIGSLKTS